MMTRNQTAIAAAAATATATTDTIITISNDSSNTVLYPSMFDRWRLPI
jgi:hypothetical protein